MPGAQSSARMRGDFPLVIFLIGLGGLRRALALGLSVGGIALVPLLPVAAWLGSWFGGVAVAERRLVDLSVFLFTRWGIPAAGCLILVGYLLQPPRGPWFQTRLSMPLRLAVAAGLWLQGMVCLLGVLMLVVAHLLGLASLPVTVRLGVDRLPLTVLALHAPILVLGTLFLLAARKWLRETR